MRAGDIARVAYQRHRLAAGHLIPLMDKQLAAMGVKAADIVGVADFQIFAKLVAVSLSPSS